MIMPDFKLFWKHLSVDYVLISWLFLRGLALIYFAAFASMAVQIEGLIGSNGILPATEKLGEIEQFFPQQKYWRLPTVFWFDASDAMLEAVCFTGMAAAVLLLVNVYVRAALTICFLLYLSLLEVGQDFMLFQWDAFLLEIGVLGLFLSWRSGIVILLLRWLLARFMFMGGVVKLASGDPAWANLTALNFHYETQPLPTPIAYYAHRLPAGFHQFSVAGVFVIELIVPFFVFLPRPFRLLACGAFVLLQGSIVLTGNYNFFNLLVLLLCLCLLQDKDIVKWLPQGLSVAIRRHQPMPGAVANVCAGLWAGVVISVCAGYIWLYHVKAPLPGPLAAVVRTTAHLSVVNNYGPFAVMTTKRHEIIVQGSNDGRRWRDYRFQYKPGRLDRPLSWNIPHQPRLDWQMWFAALAPPRTGAWFDRFLKQLLRGSRPVLALLAENPFPEHPPRYVRALLYHYSYTTLEQRRLDGTVWQRQFERIYWPVRELTPTGPSAKQNG